MLLHLRDDAINQHLGTLKKLPQWLKDVLEKVLLTKLVLV
jgi:hypothetical protein